MNLEFYWALFDRVPYNFFSPKLSKLSGDSIYKFQVFSLGIVYYVGSDKKTHYITFRIYTMFDCLDIVMIMYYTTFLFFALVTRKLKLYLYVLIWSLPKYMFVDFRERGREREGKREWGGERKREWERETLMWEKSIDQLPPVCTLTQDRTLDFLVYGTMLQPTDPPGAAQAVLLITSSISASVSGV